MKVIIIEGPDNTGKNTLINEILEKNEIVKVVHCGKPNLNGNVLLNQFKSFKKLADTAIDDYLNNSENIFVYNRYHIGEYVYGQLYRNEHPEQILETLKLIETHILERIPQDDILYIQLLSTSPELLRKNDDKKSLSNADIELIKKELELFKIAYDHSLIKNKHIIYVNKENTDEFKSREEIIKEFNQQLC